MFAALASRSTVSQPVSTTGENAMTSTLLRDERAQRLDLVFLLLLRVGETQVDAGFRRRALNGLGVGRAPFALGADLAEAEHDGARRPLSGRDSPPEQATNRAAVASGQRHPNEALHRSPLK